MQIVDILQQWYWWVPLVCIPLGILATHLGVNLLYKYVYPKLLKKGFLWRAFVIQTLYQPFKLFLWFAGLSLLVSLYAERIFEVGLIHMITDLLKVGVIVAISWALYIFTREGEKVLLTRKNYDVTMVEFFSKLSLIAIVVLTMLLVLPLFGIQIAGILAFGGFSGLVVGMAAKDSIANVIGGFIIAIDKPFKIGDWICSQDGGIEGIVEHIGWRLTKVRTFEKKPLYIPNSLFSSLVITNASRMSHRRILTRIGLRYQDIGKIDLIVKAIDAYIESSSDIDQRQSNYVNFVAFGESSLEIELRAYTKATVTKEYYSVLQKFLIDVYKIIELHEAGVPFPTQTVLVESVKERFL